ncbi:O-antigen ligase family protein [Flavobacterium sp.]|uniref:O-antigen ligase family protein n=1 Tax=Flavobacterium sp. TaxID=239 RepID=UPI002602919D|nr:O-antigen ligase family protein [Flavobacterium sp.]MDG2433122.1 O-antigen ligase family protein [Flavobacterium sp.]
MKTIKKANGLRLLIALPLLLELLFFFNTDSYYNEVKILEKYAALPVFAWFIIGNYHRVHFYKLLTSYAYLTLLIVLFYWFLFIGTNPILIAKYQSGIDLWEMGYVFSQSMGLHAPALNMHMAFVTVIFLYLILQSFQKHRGLKNHIFRISGFVISFFMVLFINTRMALVNVFLGMLIVFFYALKEQVNVKKTIKVSLISIIISVVVLIVFVKNNNYMTYKYQVVTFAYMDKVGKLDEIKNPEAKIFNSMVTRLSIWKSAWELSLQNLPFGTGASQSKTDLIAYYKQTNQQFLAKYEFPTHNQFLDYFLKYGFLGPIVVLIYLLGIAYLGLDLKQPVVLFFFVSFFTSNCIDDFLIRFDGIVFSSFWFAVFGSYWLQQKAIADKVQQVL